MSPRANIQSETELIWTKTRCDEVEDLCSVSLNKLRMDNVNKSSVRILPLVFYLFTSSLNTVGKPVADALQYILHHSLEKFISQRRNFEFLHLVIRVLQDGKELFCSKLTDLALRRFSCELLRGGNQGNLLHNRQLRRGEICQKNLDCCCWKSGLVFAEPNKAAEEVGVHFVPEEVEGRDVVVVDDMFAVVGIALVQLLADPIKELLEFSQGGIGGININPVFDHLQSECKERA